METLQTLEKLEIGTNKLFYDKKTEVLSVYLPDFVFIGTYKKSVRIEAILDDIYKSLGETQLTRQKIAIVDFVTLQPFLEKTKLKNLKLISKKQKELKKEEKKPIADKRDKAPKDIEAPVKSSVKEEKFKHQKARPSMPAPKPAAKAKKKEKAYDMEDADYGGFTDDEMVKSSEERFDEFKLMEEAEEEPAPPELSRAPVAPPPPPGAGAPARPAAEELSSIEKERVLGGAPRGEPIVEEPKQRVYEINMGLQYYSVMMEQTSYLFYVYLSHKELKIVDEEGKTVFETSFVIKTTKKEPPILNLRVEGKGFEVHPLFGKVEVSKDAVNPPVMIFSVLPVKNKERSKKDKKEGDRRHLHVYIDFEDKVINHSILSIIVQPKHFHLDIGPIHLDVSKKAAAIISFISIIIAVGSLLFTIFSFDPQSTVVNVVGNFAPGLGSLIFIAIFLYTLFKEGLYPLKAKISYFLNFDKTGTLVK
ncbi:MAG: hypothetical protein HWN79_04900 [Candidatus Lokiarchaeota archaeon]|nr:hypothetical protein [Candidatus Lokiarchaeota archaeon]